MVLVVAPTVNRYGDHKPKIIDVVGLRVSELNQPVGGIVKGREAHGEPNAAKWRQRSHSGYQTRYGPMKCQRLLF